MARSEQALEDDPPSNNTGTRVKVEDDGPPRLKNPLQPIPIALELTIRMTVTALIAYSLAFVQSPKLLPPTQQWLIGLLATVVVMRIPTFIFTVGGMITVVYALVAFGLASATLLLYCVDVGGNELMVAVATLWALWVSGLRYGPLASLIGIFPSILVAVVGLIGLGGHRLVRDGFAISINQEVLIEIKLGVDRFLSEIFNPIIVQLIKTAVAALNIPELIESQEDGIPIPIPAIVLPNEKLAEVLSIFEGRFLNVRLDADETLSLSLDGGMWWIKGFWTWTGTENPFAVIQNFLIVCSWAFLAVFCAHLLPPWRSMRYEFARIRLPQALRDTAAFVKLPTPKRGRILYDTSFHTHNPAPALLTALEPRFADWRYNWPRCTYLPLFRLTKVVEKVMLKALLLEYIPNESVSLSVHQNYQANAKALHDRVSPEDIHDEEEDAPSVEEDPLWQNESAKELDVLTRQYLDSMNFNPTTKLDAKSKVTNLLLVILPFLAPPLLLFGRLFVEIPITTFKCLTGRDRFDLQKAAHHVKFALGFCALFSMSVYWDDFHDLSVQPESSGVAGIRISSGNPTGSFAGWQLIAYSFATMPTTEGTLKKCVLRVLGTLLGAASAWAAINLVGDNNYGFVAWLTITTAGAAYLAVDKGEDAERSRMKGTSPDYGYTGFYIVLTQAVICMEFLTGMKQVDELVVNRIISNLTGIAAASILSLVPPCVRGSDTKWTGLILSEARLTMKECLETLLNGKPDSIAAIKKRFAKTSDSLRDDADYLLQDAKRLNIIFLGRVDPRLEKALIAVGTTSSFLCLALDRVGELSKEGQFALTEENRQQLELVLAHVQSGKQFVRPEENLGWSSSVDVVANLLHVVQRRLVEHAVALEEIRTGVVSKVADQETEAVEAAEQVAVAEEVENDEVVRKDENEHDVGGGGGVSGDVWC